MKELRFIVRARLRRTHYSKAEGKENRSGKKQNGERDNREAILKSPGDFRLDCGHNALYKGPGVAFAMKHIDTAKKRAFFKPLMASAHVQVAMMVLSPGQSSTDKPKDEHPKAEQWLFVISGVRLHRLHRAVSKRAGICD